MTHLEKIQTFESCLNQKSKSYRDSFKTDLYLFFDEDFSVGNLQMDFLHRFETPLEIEKWIEFVTSQIVLKFDGEVESLGDFVEEFFES